MNIVPFESQFSRRRMKAGLLSLLGSERYTHAITLCPNRGEMTFGQLEKLFRAFCLGVDRYAAKRQRVSGIPSAERFNAIGIPEKLETNAHLHLAAELNHSFLRRPLDEHVKDDLKYIWKCVCASGTSEIEVIHNKGWPRYMTKSGLNKDSQYILSWDFHPPQRMLYFAPWLVDRAA